jgi:hypothetical protein
MKTTTDVDFTGMTTMLAFCTVILWEATVTLPKLRAAHAVAAV